MLRGRVVPSTSGTILLRDCTAVKVPAGRWILALAVLVTHAKRVPLAVHEKCGKPFSRLGSAFVVFAFAALAPASCTITFLAFAILALEALAATFRVALAPALIPPGVYRFQKAPVDESSRGQKGAHV